MEKTDEWGTKHFHLWRDYKGAIFDMFLVIEPRHRLLQADVVDVGLGAMFWYQYVVLMVFQQLAHRTVWIAQIAKMKCMCDTIRNTSW